MRTTTTLRRWSALVPAFLAAVLALQCIEPPLSPIAPTWQTQLSIPLAEVTALLADAIVESPTIKTDAGGGITFEDVQDGQPVGLDTLKVSPQPASEQVSLGTVEIAALPPLDASITASDLGLATGTWPPFPAPAFPSTPANLPSLSVGDTTLFAYAAIDTGSLTMTITNTLPLAVTFGAPIELKNNVPGIDTNLVASFAFGTVDSLSSKTVTSSLANVFAWGLLRTSPVSVTIQGRQGPFTIGPSSGLQFAFSSSNLRVDSARAVVPPQQVVTINDSVIVVDDSVSVTDARFRRGTFSARIVNNLDVQVGVRLKFGNFKSLVSGDTMSILRVIPPRGTTVFPFSLDTLRLVNPSPEPTGTRVKFSVGIETITSAGQKSTITSGDFVRAEFTPQNDFVLQSITGKIKPTTFEFNSGASGLNVGDAAEKFAGQFTFDSVRINVGLGLSGGYKVRYSLRLEARNRKYNKQASIILPPPAGATDTIFTPTPGGFVAIPLGDPATLNGFLSNFFPNFPDTFIVRGSVTVNPGFESATIADTAKLYQRVNVQFPLRLALAGGRIEDKIGLGEESSFPTDFAKDIKQTSIAFSVGNRIPAQLGFQLRLFRRPTPSIVDTVLMIPSDGTFRTIGAASVDASGNATAEAVSHFEIGLTTTEVEQFNRADSMLFRISLQTSGSGTQVVRFRTSDYVRIRMTGNMTYIVNNQN